MAILIPVYCTREDVKIALDIHETVRDNALVDRAVSSAATDIYGLLHRRFYPEDGTKYFDWPNYQYAYPWRVWLDQYDLVSASSVTTGGSSIELGDIFFEPVNKEADEPYTYFELNRATSASFGLGPTPQHDIAITGTWGYTAATTSAGALADSAGSSDTTLTVTDSSSVGVGSILLIDSERFLVTDRAMVTTGQTLQADIDAANNAVTVEVGDGTQFYWGEILLIDSERVFISDIAGNNLTVKRAWDGSVLAAHTMGATIYAPRLMSVTRGALGTTAATHSSTTAISKYIPPGLIYDLSVALAINNVLQATSGYSRTVGEGDNVRNASGAAIADLVARAQARYGRKARQRVI